MVIAILILLFGILVFVSIALLNRGQTQRRRHRGGTSGPGRQPLYEDGPLPEALGIQPDLPLRPAVERLEQALAGDFPAMLRERVQRKHPQMTTSEFNWKFLELKRYFLMTAILKDVPMFSEAVDDIWHEMLMFTREYHRFSEAFVGSVIHHAPHSGGEPNPGGRAWFDWVYANLFIPTPYSSRIWTPFFRYPLDRGRLEELREADEAELADRLFNRKAAERYPEIGETIARLIRKATEQAADAETGAVYSAEKPAHDSASYMPYLAGALIVYSAADLGDFDDLMAQHYAEEEARRREQEHAASSSSGCGSSGGSGSWDDDRGGGGSDDGGSSSGGSSSGCSSSSCSSGCGGGGD
ncbi:hypothetical protein [Paenibacillus validus]|uniref:hypothetical protein n=1 Tax=Paenibacillus validus TaxID=44253 RepID=UPI003D2C9C67